MNVLDVVFQYFEHRIPPSSPNPEEDVYNMRYRNRYFSLFPEDLNKDYNPYDFIEEPVEPRSFRKILTGLIGWTVIIPFILFLLLYQKNIETLSSLVVDRQSLSTLVIKTKLDSADGELHNRAIKAINEYLTTSYVEGGLTLAGASEIYRTVQSDLLDAHVRIKDFNTGKTYSFGQPPTDEKPYVTLVPFDATGLQKITMEISMPVDVVAASLREAMKESGGEAFLVDERGKVLFATDPSLAIENSDFEQIKAGLAHADLHVMDDKLADNKNGVFRTAVKLNQTEYYLIFDQSKAARNLELQHNLIVGSLFFLLAIGSVFVVGYAVSRPLSRSVGELSDAVGDFPRTGKVEVAMSSDAPTELQELAERFEKMGREIVETQERLRSMNKLLEQKVRSKTDALTTRNAELAAIQKLLAPIDTSLVHLTDETVARFKQLLRLSSLAFRTSASLQEGNEGPDLPSGAAFVQVRYGNKIYGWLETDAEELKKREVRDSLELLANSLAVQLNNHHLLVSTVQQHQLLEELFSSMNEGVLLMDSNGVLVRFNAYLEERMARDGIALKPGCLVSAALRQAFEIREKHQDGFSPAPIAKKFEDGRTYELVPVKGAKDDEGGRVYHATAFSVVSTNPDAGAPDIGLLVRDVSADAEVERLKDQLISIVAHELKTPITALRLQAETLATQIGLEDEERDQILADMQEESFRLRRLVDDWLDLTRFRDGHISLMPKIMHIATPIDKAAKLVTARFELKVTRTIDLEAECFKFDPERITQVFINLFSNAARYFREGVPPVVHVDVRRDGDKVRIRVQDNGIGIPKDKATYVFERFYQADMTIARQRGGTGLGLAIVKGIVMAHQGTISLDSEPGCGTCFTIELPY